MLSLIYGTAQNCPDNFRFFRLDQSHALENGVVRGGEFVRRRYANLWGEQGSFRAGTHRNVVPVLFFDHRNAVPVLFDI